MAYLSEKEYMKRPFDEWLLSSIILAEFFWYPRIDLASVNFRIADILIFFSFICFFVSFRKNIGDFVSYLENEKILFGILGVILFFTAVSAVLSDYFFISVKKTIQVFENMWLMAFAMRAINRKNIGFLLNVMSAAAIFHALFSIFFQYFSNSGDIYAGDIVRISGLSAGYFSTHLLVAFIFAAAFYFLSASGFLRLIVPSVLLVCIFLTQVRTIWILLGIFFGVVSFFDFSWKKIGKIFGLLALSALIFVGLLHVKEKKHIDDRWGEWINTLQKRGTQTASIRMELWKSSLKIFRCYPVLGSGPGTFGEMYAKYSTPNFLGPDRLYFYSLGKGIDAHSPFFTRLAELGSVASAGYVFLFLFLFYRAKEKLLHTKDPLDLSLFLFVIIAFFSDIISDQLGLKLFWIILGVFIKKTSGKLKYE